MKHPKHPLNIAYLLLLLITIICVMFGYRYGQAEGMGWQPMETVAINIYTFIILFCLVSIPTMLWGFSKWVKNLKVNYDNEALRLRKYVQFGIARIVWLGVALQASILGYYFLHQNGLIYMTGICVLALFFIKPTKQRVEDDLQLNKEDEVEIETPLHDMNAVDAEEVVTNTESSEVDEALNEEVK